MTSTRFFRPDPLVLLRGRSPLLRLESDDRLVARTRDGQDQAFEALLRRHTPPLLAFCRYMLGSREDAEDALQEVFTSAYNAMLADDRPINARPWLYRIARNRCLNHLRRPVPVGHDSMDVFEGGDDNAGTPERVHKREELRQIVADVQDLPEMQRSALLLREMDALPYDQIAEAMETTVPSVKSLLVHARVSLAEAAEGLGRTSLQVRRHPPHLRALPRRRRAVRPAGRIDTYPVGKTGPGSAPPGNCVGGPGGGSASCW
jgi:RNA polymerase sigma factor (sigma-70 family)